MPVVVSMRRDEVADFMKMLELNGYSQKNNLPSAETKTDDETTSNRTKKSNPPPRGCPSRWEDTESEDSEDEDGFLSICDVDEYIQNRENPAAVANWGDIIHSKMISILRRWWVEDGMPSWMIAKYATNNSKHLKMRAHQLADKFAKYGTLGMEVDDIRKYFLMDARALQGLCKCEICVDENPKEKEDNPPAYEDLFGDAGQTSEMTESGTRDGATADPNELKKKKKKNKNNQKERMRIKREKEEKEKLEKKQREEKEKEEKEKKKKQERKGKENKLRDSPCGNLLCEENAMHRCNKCKEIAFCSQECFEKSSHPKRCSGRNEQNISEVD